MQHIPGDDPRLGFCGAIDVTFAHGVATPLRVPAVDATLFPGVIDRATHPAGVRVTFASDTSRLVVHAVNRPADGSPLDLVVNDGEPRRSHGERTDPEATADASADASGTYRFAFEGLPEGPKELELWLPQFGTFGLAGIEIDAGATLETWRPAGRSGGKSGGRRWVTYGSSITQCRQADGPTQTWPALVARSLQLDLVCLGYGGQCHLDPMVARLIRDTPADLISICCGINIHGASSLGPRTFLPAVLGTVRTTRDKHPTTPLLLISPIFGVQREVEANAVGFKLPAMRAEVARAVDLLRDHGDAHLTYLDGLSLLGEADSHLLPDTLHPNTEGYALMAKRLTPVLAKLLGE